MGTLKALAAAASVASLVLSCVWGAGCANATSPSSSAGGDAASDAAKTQGADVTTHAETGAPDALAPDATEDRTVPLDRFVAPILDASDAAEASAKTDAADGGAVKTVLDAGFDGGLVFFGSPGSPCSTLGARQAQQCGVCGQQLSDCIRRPDGGVPFDAGVAGDAAPHDAGPDLVWGAFGTCSGELDGGCVPGTMSTQTCGRCGTETIVCENDCQLGGTNCTGEKPDGCVPGTVDFNQSAACTGPGLSGVETVCTSSCEWDASTTCVTPPSALTASTNPGVQVDTFVDLETSQEDPTLAPADCPTTFAVPATTTPYAYVTVSNPSPTKTLTASIWTSQPTGSSALDVEITTYKTVPVTTSDRKDCTNTLTDTCADNSDPTSCLGMYGGLMIGDLSDAPPPPPENQTNAVVIPGGGSIQVFLQCVNVGDFGLVRLSVRTESLQ